MYIRFPANNIFRTLILTGSIGGQLSLSAAPNTTSYDLVFPPAQGAMGDTLVNDGDGNLSWAPGGGASSDSFYIMQTPAGTSPTATSPTDTLTWASTSLSITGNAATDTITLEVAAISAAVITSGTLAIARGGTNSGTALNNNRLMISNSGAIVEATAITASRALASDANGIPVAATTTATELGYVNGVTSAIQTQLNTKAPTASPAFTTQVTFGNYHMEPGETDAGNSGTSDTIDWSLNSSQKSTLTGNVTYTFSNPQTGGAYVLRVLTGAGSFTVTWPSSVKWAGGSAPTVTTTASRMDLFNFYYDGTNYYGSYVQNYTP